MNIDYGSTFLYIFFAILQLYIFISVGLISGLKNLYTNKAIKTVSQLLLNFIFPIYALLEISRMASWSNILIMWHLILSAVVSVLGGYCLALILHYTFKLDVRIKRSYCYIIANPAVGTLPLVIARALCYPGGILEGDDKCGSILGYMVVYFLMSKLILFLMGFTLIPKDASFANNLNDKLGYLWHYLIPKVVDKNFTVLYIFRRFIKDKEKADKLFEDFESSYKLEMKMQDEIEFKFNQKGLEEKEI